MKEALTSHQLTPSIPVSGDSGGIRACLGKDRGDKPTPAEANDSKFIAALALQEVNRGVCVGSKRAIDVLG